MSRITNNNKDTFKVQTNQYKLLYKISYKSFVQIQNRLIEPCILTSGVLKGTVYLTVQSIEASLNYYNNSIYQFGSLVDTLDVLDKTIVDERLLLKCIESYCDTILKVLK